MGRLPTSYLSRSFRSEPATAAVARRFVREVCVASTCDVDLDAAVLLTTELVANAALHARGSELQVCITVDLGGVRIEVSDEDPVMPVAASPYPDDTSGRGLQLVDGLADSWGAERHVNDGKSVWFCLAARTG